MSLMSAMLRTARVQADATASEDAGGSPAASVMSVLRTGHEVRADGVADELRVLHGGDPVEQLLPEGEQRQAVVEGGRPGDVTARSPQEELTAGARRVIRSVQVHDRADHSVVVDVVMAAEERPLPVSRHVHPRMPPQLRTGQCGADVRQPPVAHDLEYPRARLGRREDVRAHYLTHVITPARLRRPESGERRR